MTMIISLETEKEKALLIGLVTSDQKRWDVEDHLRELESLARTAGAEVADTILQERMAPDPAYFIGKGKVEEIAMRVREERINMLIFDDELSPAQMRNLENKMETKIVDRTALILHIFAEHAKTNAAKTQVELAQLNYLLPRLTRQWQHLSRQVGGIGTKGPGETQLETDRRLVRTRISKLQSRLERIEQQGITQRQKRKHTFRASLIGYTNAGKSTIMNTLSGSEVLVQNILFATLDTTVRRITVNGDHDVLLSDTVGFIRKLPHHLVASFRTTLSEVIEADLLIHVVDISHPALDEHINVVHGILKDMSLSTRPRLMVFNKVDILKKEGLMAQLKVRFPDALFVSGRRRIGMGNLKKRFIEIIESGYETEQITLNHAVSGAEYQIRPYAKIIKKDADEHNLYLTVKYPKENKTKLLNVLSRLT